jgi:hypothetical protein
MFIEIPNSPGNRTQNILINITKTIPNNHINITSGKNQFY